MATVGMQAHGLASHSILDRRVTVFCLLAVAATIGWDLVDRTGLESVSPIIAAVGIIIGIPHGAMDHLVPGLASRRWLAPSRAGLVIGVYVLVLAVAALTLIRFPDLSFSIFLVVSALHFGWAEATFAAERNNDAVPRLREAWSAAVAHGSIIVVLPLWSTAGQAAMRPLVPNLIDSVAAVPRELAVSAVVLVCGVAAIQLAAHRSTLAAAELIAVLALFMVVPAFAAFGVYFGLWHAVRHTTRLMDVLAPGQPTHLQIKAFARAAALPTAAALITLGSLFAARSNAGLVMTGVSVLLALTFPHVLVVALLDHHRRIGTPPPSFRR